MTDRSDSSRERIELTKTMWGLAERVGGLTQAVKDQNDRIERLPDENHIRKIVDDSLAQALEIHTEICSLRRDRDATERISQVAIEPADIDTTEKKKNIITVSVAIGAGIVGVAGGILQWFGIIGK